MSCVLIVLNKLVVQLSCIVLILSSGVWMIGLLFKPTMITLGVHQITYPARYCSYPISSVTTTWSTPSTALEPIKTHACMHQKFSFHNFIGIIFLPSHNKTDSSSLFTPSVDLG